MTAIDAFTEALQGSQELMQAMVEARREIERLRPAGYGLLDGPPAPAVWDDALRRHGEAAEAYQEYCRDHGLMV